jgi:uncharacterized membrane protein
MSEAIEKPTQPQGTQESERDRSLRTIGNVSYALHAVVALAAVLPGVQVSVAILLVAFILDMVKRGDAHGSWQASHFTWRIRSVLWAGGLYVVTAPLWFLLLAPGWIAWSLISIWFAYRIVRGWLSLNDRRPMPV